MIDLCGSTLLSQPPNTTFLKVNQQSVGMDNSPGINTVILHPNGTFKAKVSHNVAQSATQWNSWADWVNTTAANGDVIAVASFGIPPVPAPPAGGSAATCCPPFTFRSVCPPFSIAFLFIKGQARSVVAIALSVTPHRILRELYPRWPGCELPSTA